MNNSTADLMKQDIRKLAAEKDALILTHYYCRPDIHDVADIVGDSLALSQAAAQQPHRVILFCGVHFMAETASILCPDKTVLLANQGAGCPMADMVGAVALRERKKQLPGVPVVTYVNSSAAVKAESDICCTSANVVAVLKSLAAPKVLMTPDKNLAAFAQSRVPDKEVLLWPGYCPVHENIEIDEVRRLMAQHPEAKVLAHPECPPNVLALAHEVGSTSGILAYCRQSADKEFIILTEEGILYPLKKENPDKHFYTTMIKPMCNDMKLTTLEDVFIALSALSPEVKVPDTVRLAALTAVKRMLAVPRD